MLLLAATFLVAGAVKLTDHDGAVRAFSDFGIPAAWHSALAVTLPIVEDLHWTRTPLDGIGPIRSARLNRFACRFLGRC
jgi:hypothetical protein